MKNQIFVYSAKENAFYFAGSEAVFGTSWPVDAVSIEQSIFDEFAVTPKDGKRRVAGADGLPAWEDIPPPSDEDIKADAIAEAERKKSSLKAAASAEISWRQDAVDAGIATEEETAALSEWKKYRVLLMRVDTAKPVWPTPPGKQAS
ncbi:tail fiber assembly protein [Citrobacter sp. RHBSTW-00089]|uniref:tail fiber assembly protein n=1 Tax=Citrobacter sp. RHBSTW-00089 TaxID=2742633 RepID=UPI0015FC2D89|nr:tail fiber assembly protein [Citrobacter sp. RHBSTW-00089]MBA8090517.1 tail fiber assembly protein [Citrobacter sp. RHBSTW-00089]